MPHSSHNKTIFKRFTIHIPLFEFPDTYTQTLCNCKNTSKRDSTISYVLVKERHGDGVTPKLVFTCFLSFKHWIMFWYFIQTKKELISFLLHFYIFLKIYYLLSKIKIYFIFCIIVFLCACLYRWWKWGNGRRRIEEDKMCLLLLRH